MNKHRLGRFILHQADLRRWETNLLPLMGNFVVVDASWRYDLNAIEYVAYSPLFDEIEGGIVAPEYEITVAQFPDAPAVINAVRKDLVPA